MSMTWLNKFWPVMAIIVALAVVNVFLPQTKAALPLAVIMWTGFVFSQLMIFTGLYSCTMTGNRRRRCRDWAVTLFRVAEIPGLTFQIRMGLSTLMVFAGWSLTAFVYSAGLLCTVLVAGEIRQWARA